MNANGSGGKARGNKQPNGLSGSGIHRGVGAVGGERGRGCASARCGGVQLASTAPSGRIGVHHAVGIPIPRRAVGPRIRGVGMPHGAVHQAICSTVGDDVPVVVASVPQAGAA